MTDIVLPESLIGIRNYAFYSCTNSITFKGDASILGTSSIPNGTTINYYEDKTGYDSEAYTVFLLFK